MFTVLAHAGGSGAGSVDTRACTTAPPQGFGVPVMVPPPPNGVPTDVQPDAAPVTVLSGCPKTPPGLTAAGLYTAAACSADLRNVSYSCYTISNVHTPQTAYPWYASADLEPPDAPSDCPSIDAGIMVFGLRQSEGYGLMFIARRPVCGTVTGPTGGVRPVVLYELLGAAMYSPSCP